MTKIIVNTKERILQYLDYAGVSKTNFFVMTDIKRGFLDSDKLFQAVTDENLSKIIAAFPDISLLWLVKGEGEMLNELGSSLVARSSETGLLDEIKVLIRENGRLEGKIEMLEKELALIVQRHQTLRSRLQSVLSGDS